MIDEIQRSRRMRRLLNSIRRATLEQDTFWTNDGLNVRDRMKADAAFDRLGNSWQILDYYLRVQDKKRAGGGR